MNQFRKFFGGAWSILVVCALAFAMGGCEGDDGAPGPQGATGETGATGATGATGPAGPGAIVVPFESCAVCHDTGSFVDAGVAHALPPIEAVSDIVFGTANADADLTVAFHVDILADGGPVPATTYDEVQRAYFNDGTFRTDLRERDPVTLDSLDLTDAQVQLENLGEGDYLLTVFGYGAEAANANRWLFRVAAGDDRETRVYFYGDTAGGVTDPVAVTAEDCQACHGPEGIGVHGGYFQAADGGEVCLACHGVERETVEEIDGVDQLVVKDTPSLGLLAHEYHSGLLDPITYPTYMNNCSVCHDKEAGFLAAANAMPVTADGCFSCHGDMSGIPFEGSAAVVHANITSGCEACHAGQIPDPSVPQTVAQAHNGATTERGGIIWDGEDTSVTEGAKFAWTITGVVDDGTDLSISWTATYDDGVAPIGLDPCNAVSAEGPLFFADENAEGRSLGNLSIIRNYAQGEDFILGTREDRAGQPGGTPGVSNDNTTCENGVATTVVPVEETTATVGRVAIQGKPRVVSVDPDDADGLMAVRAKTPTYDWVIGDGAAADPRRAVVDSSLCLNCHVGSLYQHGGNRVDNVDMCMLCHNVAANDEYVRATFGGIDASEAYDGRLGQAFGMKELAHGVHPAGATGNPVVVYRSRGIYAWATSTAQLQNWPAASDCEYEDDDEFFPGNIVFGSDADTATSRLCQPHNFHAPTFPRGLYDCAACHVATVDLLPDPTLAMATTVEAGAPPYGDQLNDVLQGVQTTSCVSCHADSATKGHAYQNGWVPQEFPMGRQTIIDAN
jgi:OmcA/MtrC family decaheme c-type cytochrome